MIVQGVITTLSIPLLIIKRKPVLVCVNDKLEKGKDYDFRKQFIYEEFKEKDISFVECVRSLSSAKKILAHAWRRRRPIIYSEYTRTLGRFFSFVTGGRGRARRQFGNSLICHEEDPEKRFHMLLATQYLMTFYDDIWAIRIMSVILKIIGIRTALITVVTERNFDTAVACKLNHIPTVGILHGAHTQTYNVYEFMPAFDGEKKLSVDAYGVWSEWWRDFFVAHTHAYKPEQIFVSGPMRPLQKKDTTSHEEDRKDDGKLKVLLVSEIVAVPEEVLPYLRALLEAPNISLYIKFRSQGDVFEDWLKNKHPYVLEALEGRLLKGGMQEAIAMADVVVGSQSTGVIEAVLQDKPFVFFKTKKWGDYFNMKSFDFPCHFFAENESELLIFIQESKNIPVDILRHFRDMFFGDPYKNGSKWVVEQLEKNLK